MKKVLIITYEFPPVGGSGVQRVLKFTKYLSEYGWEPIILTVDETRRYEAVVPSDSSLLNELPQNLKIYKSGHIGFSTLLHFLRKGKLRAKNVTLRARTQKSFANKVVDFMRPFMLPDSHVGWYPFAIWKGKQVFHENTIDVIYTTSPSPVTHLIAMSLVKKSRKPWVADFRDPWKFLFIKKRPFPFEQWDASMKKSVLENADKIVVAWPAIQENFTLQTNNNHRQKTILIYNGFDEQDFQDIIPKAFPKFTIVHTGTFLKERNPEALFKAITVLLRNKPALRNDIQVMLIGKKEPLIENLIEENNLNDVVITGSYLPHRECLSYLVGADMLFLNTVQNYVPGKIFEYLRSKRPILALVSDDTTVAEIVHSTQSGIIIDPSDTEKIKDTILEMYEKYKKGGLKLNREDDSVIYQYERKHLTGKLATIFDELTEKKEI